MKKSIKINSIIMFLMVTIANGLLFGASAKKVSPLYDRDSKEYKESEQRGIEKHKRFEEKKAQERELKEAFLDQRNEEERQRQVASFNKLSDEGKIAYLSGEIKEIKQYYQGPVLEAMNSVALIEAKIQETRNDIIKLTNPKMQELRTESLNKLYQQREGIYERFKETHLVPQIKEYSTQIIEIKQKLSNQEVEKEARDNKRKEEENERKIAVRREAEEEKARQKAEEKAKEDQRKRDKEIVAKKKSGNTISGRMKSIIPDDIVTHKEKEFIMRSREITDALNDFLERSSGFLNKAFRNKVKAIILKGSLEDNNDFIKLITALLNFGSIYQNRNANQEAIDIVTKAEEAPSLLAAVFNDFNSIDQMTPKEGLNYENLIKKLTEDQDWWNKIRGKQPEYLYKPYENEVNERIKVKQKVDVKGFFKPKVDKPGLKAIYESGLPVVRVEAQE